MFYHDFKHALNTRGLHLHNCHYPPHPPVSWAVALLKAAPPLWSEVQVLIYWPPSMISYQVAAVHCGVLPRPGNWCLQEPYQHNESFYWEQTVVFRTVFFVPLYQARDDSRCFSSLCKSGCLLLSMHVCLRNFRNPMTMQQLSESPTRICWCHWPWFKRVELIQTLAHHTFRWKWVADSIVHFCGIWAAVSGCEPPLRMRC